MTHIEITKSITRSIGRLSLPQQLKLLDFIKSLISRESEPKIAGILQFAGAFEKRDLSEMESAIEDCSKTDLHEW